MKKYGKRGKDVYRKQRRWIREQKARAQRRAEAKAISALAAKWGSK